MGRQSGYTEADIQRWYLHTEAGLPREFSGETGERLIEVAQGNQRALSGLSDEVVAAAEETYEADRMAWDRIARDEAVSAAAPVVRETTEAAGRVGRQSPAVDADRLAAAIQNTDGHDLFAYYKNLARESGFESSERWLKDEYMDFDYKMFDGPSPSGWRKADNLDEYLESRAALGPGLDHVVFADIREHALKRLDELGEAAGSAGRQTFRNVDDLRDASRPAWPGGPTIVHGSPSELADGFARRDPMGGNPLGGRPAMGAGLYTTPNMPFALRYADEATQKAIRAGNKSGATTGVFPTTASLGDMPPGFVHNVRFTGDGAPVLLDYGARGIDQKAKDAVMGSLDDLDDLLRPLTGSTLVSDRQRRKIQFWLDDPGVSFGALHGYTSEGGAGGLRQVVQDIISTNIQTGPLATGQRREIMSEALENLSIRLRDAGYHGYVSPEGGSFQQGPILSKFGQGDADLSGGMISWFTPERDLAIMGSSPYGGAGTSRAFRR
tara:strand:+ start:114 stop:1601 length:1488 start_codon:yes stop_codon:yes gene_type:complete